MSALAFFILPLRTLVRYLVDMREWETDEPKKEPIWHRAEVWGVGALVMVGALSMLWSVIRGAVSLFR